MSWLLTISLLGNIVLSVVAVYYYIQLRKLKREVSITKQDLDALKERVLNMIGGWR